MQLHAPQHFQNIKWLYKFMLRFCIIIIIIYNLDLFQCANNLNEKKNIKRYIATQLFK